MNRAFAGASLPNAMMTSNQQIAFTAANCVPPGGVMQLVSPPAYSILQSPSANAAQQPPIGIVQQPSFRLPFVDVDAVFQNESNAAYHVAQGDIKPLGVQYFAPPQSGMQVAACSSSNMNSSPSNITNMSGNSLLLKDSGAQLYTPNTSSASNAASQSLSQLSEHKFACASPLANGSSSHSVSGKYMCAICGDRATGKHYGVVSCEGCKGFFKRTVRKCLQYACREDRHCPIDKRQRNRCQFCRFEKCLQIGMKREAVQEERARANAASANASVNGNGNGNGNGTGSSNGNGNGNGSASQRNSTASASNCSPSSADCSASESRVLVDEFASEPDDEHQHAARVIVSWAKRIRAFADLPIDDRIALLRAGWNELLIATLAFRNASGRPESNCHSPAAWPLKAKVKQDLQGRGQENETEAEHDEQTLLSFGDGVIVSRAAAHRAGVGVGHVFDRVVSEIVAQMRQLAVDSVELALIRAIILFNPDARGVIRVAEVERARERVYTALEQHCRAQHVADDARFAKLLLRLPALRSVGLKCVEHLFFLKLFGEAPADAAVRELLTFSSSASSSLSAPLTSVSASTSLSAEQRLLSA